MNYDINMNIRYEGQQDEIVIIEKEKNLKENKDQLHMRDI